MTYQVLGPRHALCPPLPTFILLLRPPSRILVPCLGMPTFPLEWSATGAKQEGNSSSCPRKDVRFLPAPLSLPQRSRWGHIRGSPGLCSFSSPAACISHSSFNKPIRGLNPDSEGPLLYMNPWRSLGPGINYCKYCSSKLHL